MFMTSREARVIRCWPRLSRVCVIATLFLLGVGGASPVGAVEPSTDHDVVIVGAGAAGLYAAYTLDNLGYDVLVLEATDRHGGRVYSDMLGDVGIEHGAESLYGSQNNFIYGDINSLYGSGSQIRIFRGNSNQDQLIVMDADGTGGGSPCWSETGNCYLDPAIDDYWDFYYQNVSGTGFSQTLRPGSAAVEVQPCASPAPSTPATRTPPRPEAAPPARDDRA